MSQFDSDTSPEPPPVPVEQLQRGPKDLAVISLILGICGFIPWLGLFTAVTGIIFGIVSLAKRRAGRGLAIGGIVTGVAAIMITLAQLIVIIILLDSAS